MNFDCPLGGRLVRPLTLKRPRLNANAQFVRAREGARPNTLSEFMLAKSDSLAGPNKSFRFVAFFG